MRKLLTITLVIVLSLCVGTTFFSSQPVRAADHDVHLGDSIQAAINIASAGDTVHVVDAGVYQEKITLKSGVNVVADNPGTIIDANGSGSVVTAEYRSNTEIRGFVITGGSASNGAGFYLYRGNIVIKDCIIKLNSASSNGGGIYAQNSSPTIIGCTFRNNSAYVSGGGIYTSGDASPTITSCFFENNLANGDSVTYGGGIANNSSPMTLITSCVFKGNGASFGGGVYNYYSSPKMANCTFDGNTAVNMGGAMSSQSGTQVVTNCNYYNNGTGGYASVIYSDGASQTLTNCIIWKNNGSTAYQIYGGGTIINYSDIDVTGGYTGSNNIVTDPLFYNANNGDFHLQPGSPCIDAGNNTASFLPIYDFEGDPRIFPVTSGIVDMGVDEVVVYPATVTLSNLTQTYTGSPLTPTATTNPPGLTVTWTGAPQTNAGSYPVTATINDANYQGSASGTFTITKKAASVTPNAATKIYGAADPALTGTLTGFLAGDGVSATYSRTAGENVGSYTISAVLSPVGVLGNYNITYNTATFTINYGFKGLLQPYAAPPSDFNTGRSIPLKWQYTDSSGNVVNSSTAAPSITITLGGNSIPVGDPGKSGLQYDAITNTWQFNWQTKGLSAGTYQIWITSTQTGQRNGPFTIQLR